MLKLGLVCLLAAMMPAVALSGPVASNPWTTSADAATSPLLQATAPIDPWADKALESASAAPKFTTDAATDSTTLPAMAPDSGDLLAQMAAFVESTEKAKTPAEATASPEAHTPCELVVAGGTDQTTASQVQHELEKVGYVNSTLRQSAGRWEVVWAFDSPMAADLVKASLVEEGFSPTIAQAKKTDVAAGR